LSVSSRIIPFDPDFSLFHRVLVNCVAGFVKQLVTVFFTTEVVTWRRSLCPDHLGWLTELQHVLLVVVQFLGAFAKLRNTTVSFFMSACPSFLPSLRMEKLDSH
jgi:hypothetical protein